MEPRKLSVAVFGCGAVGLTLGGILAEAGENVTLVARGPRLARLRAHGFALCSLGRDVLVGSGFRVADASEPPPDGPPDLLLIGLKGHQMEAALPGLLRWIGPQTSVYAAQNGIPYWYCFGPDAGPAEGLQLESLPRTVSEALLPRGRAHLGGVVGMTAWAEPGTDVDGPLRITCTMLRRIAVGATGAGIDGDTAAAEVCAFLLAAGVPNVEASPRIRYEVWHKLMANVSGNAVSALTMQPLDYATGSPHTRAIMRAAMVELVAVATGLGAFGQGEVDVDARLKIMASVPPGFKPSTLQDLEADRQLELEPIWGAVLDLATVVGVEAPTLTLLYGLLRARADAMASCPGVAKCLTVAAKKGTVHDKPSFPAAIAAPAAPAAPALSTAMIAAILAAPADGPPGGLLRDFH